MTCYWQTRRNRDSITFDEWVDLDLWKVAVEGYNECCEGVCEHPEQSLVYLGNLERLGILERCEHYTEDDKEKLLSFEASDAIAEAKEKAKLKDGEKFETRRWSYQVTDFGLNFIKVCIS